jgi:ribonuclease HI
MAKKNTEYDTIILAVDGAASNNQSPDDRQAGVGYLIEANGSLVAEKGLFLGEGPEYTNNVAEYNAVIRGLNVALEHFEPNEASIVIESDSELVVKQVQKEYSANNGKLKSLRSEVYDILHQFGNWEIKQVSETAENRISEVDTMASEAAKSGPK